MFETKTSQPIRDSRRLLRSEGLLTGTFTRAGGQRWVGGRESGTNGGEHRWRRALNGHSRSPTPLPKRLVRRHLLSLEAASFNT